MDHCLIAVRPQCQGTDNGSDTQVVGTEHQTHNKDYKSKDPSASPRKVKADYEATNILSAVKIIFGDERQ